MFTSSRFMPCPECGASVEQSKADEHECDLNQKTEYELFQTVRGEMEGFNAEVEGFFAEPETKFALWEAEQKRLKKKDSPNDR